MIATTDYQFYIGELSCHPFEGLDQKLKPLIGPLFSKSKNPMGRVSPACKVWRIGRPGKDAVRPNTDPAAPVFFIQGSTIGGHEHGERVRAQE